MRQQLKFLFLGLCFMGITACVDTTPFTGGSEHKNKIFIECELMAKGAIEAYVSYPTFINEGNIIPLPAEDIVLSIAELNRDIIFPFNYDIVSRKFKVLRDDFVITPGKSYILKGYVKGREEVLYAFTEVPRPFLYDSLVVLKSEQFKKDDQSWHGEVTVRLYYDRYILEDDQYLHLRIFDRMHSKEVDFQPVHDLNRFFRLSHLPGMLWMVDRGFDQSYVDLHATFKSQTPLDEIEIHLKNNTKAYYDYHKFKSNSPSTPTPSPNPAIAGFNMVSPAGYGVLSASVEEKIVLSLK